MLFMRKVAILIITIIFSACNINQNSIFPKGILSQPMLIKILSSEDIKNYFSDLNDEAYKVIFLYGYPDFILKNNYERVLYFLPPETRGKEIWIYTQKNLLIYFTKTKKPVMMNIDDRMRYICKYGFPDNISKYSSNEGIIEVWSYYKVGLNISFLNGKEYRKNFF